MKYYDGYASGPWLSKASPEIALAVVTLEPRILQLLREARRPLNYDEIIDTFLTKDETDRARLIEAAGRAIVNLRFADLIYKESHREYSATLLSGQGDDEIEDH